MRFTLRLLAAAAFLALLIPTLSAQDKEKPKTDKKDNPAKLPTITGTLSNPGSEKGEIIVSVPYYEPQRRGAPQLKHRAIHLGQADELIVRTNQPPIFYDNGKPRKATQKELKEAKGEGNLPGYLSDLASLKAQQTVTVYYIAAKKTTAKKDDPDALTDSKPKARMILILKEPQ